MKCFNTSILYVIVELIHLQYRTPSFLRYVWEIYSSICNIIGTTNPLEIRPYKIRVLPVFSVNLNMERIIFGRMGR